MRWTAGMMVTCPVVGPLNIISWVAVTSSRTSDAVAGGRCFNLGLYIEVRYTELWTEGSL